MEKIGDIYCYGCKYYIITSLSPIEALDSIGQTHCCWKLYHLGNNNTNIVNNVTLISTHRGSLKAGMKEFMKKYYRGK